MIHDHRVRAAFGLGPFPRVVDDKRIHEWQIAEQGVRVALTGQAHGFAGKPLERPVLPDVDDGVGSPAAVLRGVASHR